MSQSQMSKAVTAMTDIDNESMSDIDSIDSEPEQFQMEVMSDTDSDDINRDNEAGSKDSDISEIPSVEEFQMEFESASDSDDDIERIQESELAQSDIP